MVCLGPFRWCLKVRTPSSLFPVSESSGFRATGSIHFTGLRVLSKGARGKEEGGREGKEGGNEGGKERREAVTFQ